MFQTLSVVFESRAEFEREFYTNIARGGLFVPTTDTFELREVVEIELVLDFCDEKIPLQAEVVHRVTPELSQTGGVAGIAVHLLDPAVEMRERLCRLVGLDPPAPLPTTWPERPGPARRHERTPTRLAAQIETTGGRVDAWANDLSQSGVLLSAGVHPVPVGEPVRVSIVHPRTGDCVELPGHVVRHQMRGAHVAAIGVQFAASVEADEAVRLAVADIQAAEHARELGAITGSISALGVASLLQMFSSSSPEGTFVVRRADECARVLFEREMLRHAELDPVRGPKALARLLTWTEGSFEFHPTILPGEPDDTSDPMQASLLEAVHRVDELSILDVTGFPPYAVVRVAGAGGESADPGKLESAILDLAARDATVQEILDGLDAYDSLIYEALTDLRERERIELVVG